MSVQGLGKAYRSYRSEWQRVARWFGLPSKPVEEHWVLRGVSFDIGAGEAVALIGQNGAGKSTLLKIITGTLHPTEGSVRLGGRIAAILELGMGFNPELTGRQNVLHAAGLMGFDARQIAAAMSDIEAFAEIGEYFEEPVRTYSSGMQMRVAFAVATAFRPDILIVDEALSVGDAYFQHKSFAKIREFQKQGTTLLIVSHDRNAVQAICDRALFLERGRVLMDGEPEAVMDYYNALIAEREGALSTVSVSKTADGRTQTVSGTGEASVESVGLFDANGRPLEFVDVGQPVVLRARVAVHADLPSLVFGYMIKDRLGQAIFGTNTYHLGLPIENLRRGERFDLAFAFKATLGVGSYSVATGLHATESHLSGNYEWRDLSLVFNVANISRETFVGVAWIPPELEFERDET
ncbi:ABC transporter ATP-binding protein [Zeimonas arvi]|nr:ABC transporter ATP-binding protein [Zeimonas arvi]